MIAHYQARTGARRSGGVSIIPDTANRAGTGEARLRRVVLEDANGIPVEHLHLGQPLRVKGTWEVLKPIPDACFEVGVSTPDGERISTALSLDQGPPIELEPGWYETSAEITATFLPHEFDLDLAMARPNGTAIDLVERAHGFTVMRSGELGTPSYPWEQVRGYVRPQSRFHEPRRVDPLDQAPAGVSRSNRRPSRSRHETPPASHLAGAGLVDGWQGALKAATVQWGPEL